jgi:bifunctional non-homologous end joining protein LigD
MKTLTQVTVPEPVTLYYRDGRSDKVYQAAVEPQDDGYVVTFAYGRRGSTLHTGIKTNGPVDFETAKRSFDQLVREKLAKGYTFGPAGVPYRQTEQEGRHTGLLPQLLNLIDEEQTARLLANDLWGAQEKLDGRRILIEKAGDKLVAVNRKGLAIGLPVLLLLELSRLPGEFTLDGECVGERYHAFDLLALNGEDLRPLPLNRRLVALATLLTQTRHVSVVLVPTAYTTLDKQRLHDELKAAGKEGIVLKLLDAAYAPGRPNSGGPALKHKFTATLSAVVSKLNEQRSVEFRLLDEEGWQVAGNVTIPPNREIPEVGQIIEIEYLYANPESGVLFQPVYLGVRSDLDQSECTFSQLKFKPEEEA